MKTIYTNQEGYRFPKTTVCSLATTLVSLLFLLPLTTKAGSATLGSNEVAAGTICVGTTKSVVHGFTVAYGNGQQNLTGINFRTSGIYTSSDLSRFQLWYATSNSLGAATQLGSDITVSLAPGSHSFSFTSINNNSSVTYYFWITVDQSASAVAGHTLSVSAMTSADVVTSNSKSGSANASGTQTFGSNLSLTNLLTSATSVCQGTSTTVTIASGILGTGVFDVTYNLSGANNATANSASVAMTLGSGTFNTSSLIGSGSTTVTVTALQNAAGCNSLASLGNTASFTVSATPATPTASNNGPVCQGSTLALTAATIAGATYNWTGANSFTSTAQNPTVSNAVTAAMSGTYSVTATLNGCTSSASNTSVSVSATPTLTGASVPDAVCDGSGAVVYLTGLVPNSTSTISYNINGGATQTVANVIADASGAANFTSAALSVSNQRQTLTVTGVTSTSSSTNCSQSFSYACSVTVNEAPTLSSASQAAVVCEGNGPTIKLTGLSKNNDCTIYYSIGTTLSGSAAVVKGNGTGSFVTPNLSAANNGQSLLIYDIVMSNTGCEMAFSQQVTLAVNALPVGSAANKNVCNGTAAAIALQSTVTGTTYTWTSALLSGATVSGNTQCSSGCGSTINDNLSVSGTAQGIERYTITPTANGCTGSTFTVDATVIPTVTMNQPSNQTLCSNTVAADMTFSSPLSGTTYSWTNSNTAIGLAASGTGNISGFTPTGVGTASVVVTPSLSGCTGSTKTFTITVNAAPTSTTSGTTSICPGNNATVRIALTGSSPWSLTYTDGTTSTTVNNILISPYTFTVSPTSTRTYTVTSLSDSRCTASASDKTGSAVVTVYSLPTSVISGTTTICNGSSATLSIALTGRAPWNLTYSDGTTSTSVTGISSSPYTFSVSPSTNKTYTVTALTDANCVSNASGRTGSAAVTVRNRPTSVTSGSTTICNGSSATISVALTGTAPWSLTYSDGSASTSVAGIATSPYTFSVSPASSSSYTITAVSDANCTATAADRTGSAAITVNARPTSAISGTTAICNGSSALLSIALTGSAPWSVTYSDGITSTTVNNIATSPYTFTVSPGSTRTYSITSLSDSHCSANAGDRTGSATVTVNASPTSITSGSATVCNGASATVSVALTGTAPWSLTYSDGSSSTTVNNVLSSPYTFTVSPLSNKTYTVTSLTDANCSSASAGRTGSAVVTVRNRPTSVISGSVNICGGLTTPVSIALTGSAPWMVTYTDGQNPVTVNNILLSPYVFMVSPSAPTTYTVLAVSDANCSAIGQDMAGDAAVSFRAKPTASLSGSTSICAGSSASLTATFTGTTPWDLTYTDGFNATTVSGITSNSYSFSVAPSTVKTYSITSVTDNNCAGDPAGLSGTALVSVLARPTATISGGGAICSGSASSVSIALTGIAPWNIAYSDGTSSNTITGILSSPYVLSASPAANSAYTVTAVADAVCSALSGDISGSANVTVNTPAVITSNPATTSSCTNDLSLQVVASGTNLGYQWQLSTDGGATFINIADGANYTGANTSSLAITGASGMNGYRYHVQVTSGGSCSNTVTSADATVSFGYSWTGTVSNDWNNGSNWSCGVVPANSTVNVVIPASVSNQPVITNGSFSINNLNLGDGVVLTNNGTLSVAGGFSGNGTINSLNGTVVYKGTAAQSVSGSTFTGKALGSLIIDNTAGVTLLDSLTIMNLLNVSTGTFNLNSKNLRFRSTAVNTARLAPVTGNIVNATNVTVERYIPAEKRAYRFLTPTVSGCTIKSNWMENANNIAWGVNNNPHPGYGTQITGLNGLLNSFDVTTTNSTSIYNFNNVSSGWTSITNAGTVMDAKKGYLVFVRGDRSIDMTSTATVLPYNSTTLKSTGTLLTGDQNYNLSIVGDWSAVSNPYPSPIDWKLIWADNPSFGQYYNYYEPTLGSSGGYITVGIDGSRSSVVGNATTEIQSGEAFMVMASASPSVFTIKESHKSAHANVSVFGATMLPQLLSATLYFNDKSGVRRLADGALVKFGEQYSKAIDNNDAMDMPNMDENIAWRTEGKNLSIQARPVTTGSDTLFMFMNHMNVKDYQLAITLSNIDGSMRAELIDSYTGTRTGLLSDNETVVTFTVSADAASQNSGRFYVILSKVAPAVTSIVNNNGKSAFNVYPNPIAGQEITFNIPNMKAGRYPVTITNTAGVTVYSQVISISNAINKGSIHLPQELASGNYTLAIGGATTIFMK